MTMPTLNFVSETKFVFWCKRMFNLVEIHTWQAYDDTVKLFNAANYTDMGQSLIGKRV